MRIQAFRKSFTQPTRILISGLLSLSAGTTALASPTLSSQVGERANAYDTLFYTKGLPKNYLDEKINPGLKKTRELRTVLPGVLYRAGGPGGQKPLPAEALQTLCEAGFSLAVYAYSENWSDPGPIKCKNKMTGKDNKLIYISGDANEEKFKLKFLAKVKEVIQDPSRGPILEHCWNGYHASGELAAVALRQFCGWDGPTASNYWLRHSGGYPLISRINKFVPRESLLISDEIQDQLCRQFQ